MYTNYSYIYISSRSNEETNANESQSVAFVNDFTRGRGWTSIYAGAIAGPGRRIGRGASRDNRGSKAPLVGTGRKSDVNGYKLTSFLRSEFRQGDDGR